MKLGDFASAYSLLPQRVATPGGLLRGEFEYAAPERLRQLRTAVPEARWDVFSLGIPRSTVRTERPSWAKPEQLMALAAALRPEHVEEALQGVSAPVKSLVHKALRVNPDERYATTAEFRDDLQEGLRASREQPYGARTAAMELLMARTEAEGSPRREGATLMERGIFPEDVPGYS